MDAPNDSQTPNEDEQQKRLNVFQRLESHIQSRTFSGLFELVPLLATVWVISFLINQTDALVRGLPFVEDRPWDFPGVGLVTAVAVCYLLGLLISNRFGRQLVDGVSVLINYIPVIRTVFGVTRQATTSLTSQFNFSRVVFLEWPREGMVAMGFVTGRAYSADRTQSLVSVYIPTVPNPTSGNMAFVIEDDVMETNLAVEDAMKLVFSGGMVLPDSISFARLPREAADDLELIGRFDTESH